MTFLNPTIIYMRAIIVYTLQFRQSNLICKEECMQIPRPPGVLHFELFYATRCHYDVIVGPTGHVPTYPPSMPEQDEAYISLV